MIYEVIVVVRQHHTMFVEAQSKEEAMQFAEVAYNETDAECLSSDTDIDHEITGAYEVRRDVLDDKDIKEAETNSSYSK